MNHGLVVGIHLVEVNPVPFIRNGTERPCGQSDRVRRDNAGVQTDIRQRYHPGPSIFHLGVQGRQAAYTIPKVIFAFFVILHITFDSLVYIHANIRKLTRITYIPAYRN